jgi:hypothetical protein
MKRYFLKLALVTLSVVTLVSCEEDTVTYGGNNFVTFDQVSEFTFPFFENNGVSEIPVNMAFPQSVDVTVNFTAVSEDGAAVEGVHYNLLTPNVITIPAGETTGYIKIDVIDNDILDDSKSLKITLTAASDANTTVGLADAGSKTKNFLIVNNDCTTTAFSFLGTLDYETSGAFDEPYTGTAVASVTDAGDCNVLLISGDFSGINRSQAAPIKFTFQTNSAEVPDPTGTLKADQQLWCEACYQPADINYNIFFSAVGTYTTSGSVKRMIVTGTTNIDGLTTVTETTVFTKP